MGDPNIKVEGEATPVSREDLDRVVADLATIKEGIEKGKGKEPVEEPEEVDINDLSPAQVISLVEDKLVRPLAQQIAFMAVKEEVRDCKAAHEDYPELEKDIKKMAMEQPHLSIEQCYRLVKSQKPPKEEKPETPEEKAAREAKEAEDKKKQEIEARKKKAAGGEKPGFSPQQVVEKRGSSVREAAVKALEETGYGD